MWIDSYRGSVNKKDMVSFLHFFFFYIMTYDTKKKSS